MKPYRNIGGFIVIILVLKSTQCVTGILRNLITDRCIHVGKSDDNVLTVSARPCSFRNTKTGQRSNPDQWVEVIPTSKVPQNLHHTIQKHLQDSIVCIHTNETSVLTGDCKSTNAILLINKVEEKSNPKLRPSYESIHTGPIFTIEQPNTNLCITIVPGTTLLNLTSCSQSNAFQRWIACRPVNACDVEISWSPARIIFPNDPFNISSDFENLNPSLTGDRGGPTHQKIIGMLQNKPSLEIPSSSTTMSSTTTEHIPRKIIVNELLYFVRNGLKAMNLEDAQLIAIISKFYTVDELQQALGTLKENFAISMDPRSLSVHKAIQIVHWMKQLTVHGLDTNVIFASERLSRIPPIPAPNPETQQSAPGANKLKIVRRRLETNLNLLMEKLADVKTVVLSDMDELLTTATPSPSTPEMSVASEMKDETSSNDMVDVIDLRLGKKHVSKHQLYE